MNYQVGKKQCSNSGRKQNDIDPLESDFMVQPPSLLEFPGPLNPPHPPGISNSLRGGGLDIFWNHTIAASWAIDSEPIWAQGIIVNYLCFARSRSRSVCHEGKTYCVLMLSPFFR